MHLARDVGKIFHFIFLLKLNMHKCKVKFFGIPFLSFKVMESVEENEIFSYLLKYFLNF